MTIRWRRFRYSVLPALCLLGALSAVFALWERQMIQPGTVGRVEAVRVNLISGIDGRLTELPTGHWQLFDPVQKGQVVARLDDSSLRALVDALRGDVATFQKELDATQLEASLELFDRRHEYLRQASQLAYEVEKYRIDILDRETLIQEDRTQLQRLNTQIELVQFARTKGVVSPWETHDTQVERAIVAARMHANVEALKTTREVYESALARQKQLPTPQEPEIEKLLAPIRASVAAAEARVREVEAQVDNLVLRSPITGKITAIYFHPGQSVSAREWIMTIGSDDAHHIVGYIRPEQRVRPVVGGRVAVRPRVPMSHFVDSTVEGIGSQWETLPLEMVRDQNVPELVLPVLVRIPEGMQLSPGEIVDLTFFFGSRTSHR